MDRWPAHMTCSVVELDPDALLVAVRGEVDLASAPAMREFAEAQLDAVRVGGALVLDLAGVEFLSAAGLRELVAIAVTARDRGVRVRLGPASELAERVLQASRVRRDLDAVSPPAVEGAGRGPG